MDIEIGGKPLSEVVPQAADYFKTSETLKALGTIALIQGVAKMYESKVKALEEGLKLLAQERDELDRANRANIDELLTLRAKLARPKAGRRSSEEPLNFGKRVMPKDVDPTTQDLLNEAYSGKRKPHSKSEARRLKVMKEESDGE